MRIRVRDEDIEDKLVEERECTGWRQVPRSLEQGRNIDTNKRAAFILSKNESVSIYEIHENARYTTTFKTSNTSKNFVDYYGKVL